MSDTDPESVEDAWRTHPAFTSPLPTSTTSPLFNKKTLWETLKQRIIQHNLRVVAEHYSSIRSERLAQLLGISASDTETYVSELVNQKQLVAKIDRPKGIIQFRLPKEPSDVLQDWSDDVSKLLELVETTSHLIQRENMVHNVVSTV